MKNILSILILSISCILNTTAQVTPIDIYRAGTNNLSINYASNSAVKDSTGGPVTAYEGTSQYVFSYTTSSWYSGGEFFIGSSVKDFSNYTHMIIAHKAVSIDANTLVFTLQDGSSVNGASVTVATNNSTYKLDTIPLSSFKGSTSLNLSNLNKLAWNVGSVAATTSGVFYIDNIQIVNLSSPLITSIAPTTGKSGDVIKVYGKNLLNTTSVSMNCTNVSSILNKWTDSIQIVIPANVSSDIISVTTPDGVANSSTSFTVTSSSSLHMPLDIYKCKTNLLGYNWSTYVNVHVDSIGGPVNAYEGNSQYVITYNSNSATWGGGIDFNINNWYNPADQRNFNNYTHLVIGWRGTSATANSFSIQFLDGQTPTVGSNFVTVGTTSNTTGYKVDTIALAKFKNATIHWDNISDMFFAMSNSNAVGTWYIDNIKLIDIITTGVEEQTVSDATFDIAVGPNPSSGVFTINNGDKKIDAITVSDCLGNIVYKTENNVSNPQIDLTNQSEGVYILTLSSNERMIKKKLVKK